MSKQLTIFDAVGDNDPVSPTSLGDTLAHSLAPDGDAGSLAKNQAIQRYLDRVQVEPSCIIETYRPNGRKTAYFRLKYRIGRKVKTVHLPGGNIRAELAQYRAKKLGEMINRGAELGEILAAVRTYSSGEK